MTGKPIIYPSSSSQLSSLKSTPSSNSACEEAKPWVRKGFRSPSWFMTHNKCWFSMVYIYIYVCVYIYVCIYIIYLTWLYNKGYEPKDITGRVPTCVFSIAHECEINIYDGCLTDHIDSCWKPVSQIHDVLEWKKPIRNTEMTIQSPNDHIVFFWASKLAQSRTFRGVVYHGFYLKDPEISKEYRNQELSAELAFCLSS